MNAGETEDASVGMIDGLAARARAWPPRCRRSSWSGRRRPCSEEPPPTASRWAVAGVDVADGADVGRVGDEGRHPAGSLGFKVPSGHVIVELTQIPRFGALLRGYSVFAVEDDPCTRWTTLIGPEKRASG